MGQIYVRGQKLWISFYDGQGKRRQTSTGLPLGKVEEARRILSSVEAKIAAGVAFDEPAQGPVSLQRFGERWIAERQKRGLRSARDDATRLSRHVYPSLGKKRLSDITTKDIRDLVRAMVAAKRLAPRSVRHVYGVLHTLCHDAVVDGLLDRNPCILKRGELPKKVDKDPLWRPQAVFSREEVEQLIGDPRLAVERRMVHTILVLTGLRFGEVAALRWSSYLESERPLGKLLVGVSYDRVNRCEKAVKSETPRQVPVHPTLAAALASWRKVGWPEMVGRDPSASDLIIPNAKGEHRHVNNEWRAYSADLKLLGLRHRRQHDLRRTFVSLAISDGARKDVLEAISHGPRGDIVSMYTTLPWRVLCEELAKLDIRVQRDCAEPATLATDESEALPAVTAEPAAMSERTVPCDSACYSHGKNKRKLLKSKTLPWYRGRDSNPYALTGRGF
jgi:integrase